MNFQMTEERTLIQNLAREFARNEIAPVAAECDRESRFPMDVFHKLRDVGLVNLTIPEAYGGPGSAASKSRS